MAITFPTAVKTTLSNAVRTAIDSGSAGSLFIRAGSTTLAVLTLNSPCGSVNGSGQLVLSVSPVPSDSSADATGTADNFQIKDSAGVLVVSGTVTVTGGGGDLTMPSVSITSGLPIDLTSFTLSFP